MSEKNDKATPPAERGERCGVCEDGKRLSPGWKCDICGRLNAVSPIPTPAVDALAVVPDAEALDTAIAILDIEVERLKYLPSYRSETEQRKRVESMIDYLRAMKDHPQCVRVVDGVVEGRVQERIVKGSRFVVTTEGEYFDVEPGTHVKVLVPVEEEP